MYFKQIHRYLKDIEDGVRKEISDDTILITLRREGNGLVLRFQITYKGVDKMLGIFLYDQDLYLSCNSRRKEEIIETFIKAYKRTVESDGKQFF